LRPWSRETLLLDASQGAPVTWRQIAELESADAGSYQAQGGMTYGGSHASHLAILSFDQLDGDPTGRDILAKADWRVPWWQVWLWVQAPGATRPGAVPLNLHTALEALQTFNRNLTFHLNPVEARVGLGWVQQPLVPLRLIA
jgi:hypothetical protein